MYKKDVLKIISHFLDPDLRDRSIIKIGLVPEDDIEVMEDEIRVAYTEGSPLCPYSAPVDIIIWQILAEMFPQKIKGRLKAGHYSQKLSIKF